MTSRGLEMPPDQNAFQIWSIWLLIAPVIMSGKSIVCVIAEQPPTQALRGIVRSTGGSPMAVLTNGVRAAAAPPRAIGRYDRVFYGGMAIAAAVMTLVGFAPTYYLRF